MSDSPDPARLLGKVGVVLEACGVNWAVIGAMAVAYHGWVRASLDADAMISMKGSSLDLEQLAGKLRAEGWTVEVRMGDPGDPLGFVVRIDDPAGNHADLIGGLKRLDPLFFDRAIVEDWEGVRLRIASVEDLIALKVFAGRAKDLEDAQGILQVRAPSVNKEMVRKLCRAFGTQASRACDKVLVS